MKKHPVLASLAALLITSSFGYSAALITVSFDSSGFLLRDNLNALLTGGTSADGNGAVLQLGYFDQATVANNFLGTWIPLSGQGSLNTGGVVAGSSPAETFNKTSIGDTTSGGGSDGQYAMSLTFTVGDPGTGNSLPGSTSIPLAIRFYNGTTLASSTFFNTVSDDAWLWKTPVDGPSPQGIAMQLSQSGLEYQGGAGSALKTTIAVPTPEPASAFLAVCGGIAMLCNRRRRAI